MVVHEAIRIGLTPIMNITVRKNIKKLIDLELYIKYCNAVPALVQVTY